MRVPVVLLEYCMSPGLETLVVGGHTALRSLVEFMDEIATWLY